MTRASSGCPCPSEATPMPDSRSRYSRPSVSYNRTPSPRTKVTGRRRYVWSTYLASRAWTSSTVVVCILSKSRNSRCPVRHGTGGRGVERGSIAPIDNQHIADARGDGLLARSQLGHHAGGGRPVGDEPCNAGFIQRRL